MAHTPEAQAPAAQEPEAQVPAAEATPAPAAQEPEAPETTPAPAAQAPGVYSLDEAWELLTRYNEGEFHLKHAQTVSDVMRWFAHDLGYAHEADTWAIIGMLHDLDFEQWPDEHCVKAQELMHAAGVPEDIIHSCVSHGWGATDVTIEPQTLREKVLFAVDELTGLIGAAALMRPSKSVDDMSVKSLKKKFKDKRFAQGCSRDTIRQGAEMLEWDLDTLFDKTLAAMRASDVVA